MHERWKNDNIKCEVIGYTAVSVKNQIKANRVLFDIMIKQGIITEKDADIEHKRYIKQLYDKYIYA